MIATYNSVIFKANVAQSTYLLACNTKKSQLHCFDVASRMRRQKMRCIMLSSTRALHMEQIWLYVSWNGGVYNMKTVWNMWHRTLRDIPRGTKKQLISFQAI